MNLRPPYLLPSLAAALALAAARCGWAEVTDYPIRVVVKTADGERQLIARNDGSVPITMRIGATDEDGESTAPWPVTVVVQPRAAATVGELDDGEATVDYSYYPGRIDAHPDSRMCYRAPYADGLAFAITQAYGGPLTSHDNAQNRHAVDFAMPEGTPVVAARAGIVADVTLDYRAHGLDRKYFYRANKVTIVHDDGTVAEYAHLAPGVPLVQRGERVAAGARIGTSGNTGYSTAPHLHFVVAQPALVRGKVKPLSIPFRFCGIAGAPSFVPRTGMRVVAAHGSALASTPAMQRVSDRDP